MRGRCECVAWKATWSAGTGARPCIPARPTPRRGPLRPARRFRRSASSTNPIGLAYWETFARSAPGTSFAIPFDCGVATLVMDGDLAQYSRLRGELQLPGFVDRMRHQAWDVLTFGVEWATGSDECALFNVPPGGRPRNSVGLGMAIHVEHGRNLDTLRGAGVSGVSDKRGLSSRAARSFVGLRR